MIAHQRSSVCAIVVMLAVTGGCRSWLFYPNQTPYTKLVKKYDAQQITEWTLGRSNPEDVRNGISALIHIANPHDSDGGPPRFSLDERKVAIRGLGRIASKRIEGWPTDPHRTVPDAKIIYWNAALAAKENPKLQTEFHNIEPSKTSEANHLAWQEAATDMGLAR